MSGSAQDASSAVSSCAGICSFHQTSDVERLNEASWSSVSLRQRLLILRGARHRMAAQAEAFAAEISPNLPRSKADTIVSELMPLLDGCKFLERNAARILAPRKLGRSGRPIWLGGVQAEIYREPLGHVLIIGPANFPLFLPGAQVLQALAAGNSVTWKPGKDGLAVAGLMGDALRAAGLPEGALRITDDSVEAAHEALAKRPDKVVFTGSASSGREVLRTLADSGTPAVVELSGADAVIVMPGADLAKTAKAIAFGLRLNGGQVCMSPRRVFAKQSTIDALKPLLLREFAKMQPVAISNRTAEQLQDLCAQARSSGAEVSGNVNAAAQVPIVIDKATPQMDVTRSDVFAPVLSLIALRSVLELPEAYAACPYALTAAIFCGREEEPQARGFAKLLRAGTVLINDLIAPTADPRVPFGGRGASGYGSTRGAEGLLEMTAVKAVLVRRGGNMRHLEPTSDADAPMLAGMLRAVHGGTWRERWRGVRTLVAGSRKS